MSSRSDSCIVCHFSHYATLSDSEVDLLCSLERNEKTVSPQSMIRASGEKTANFYTLKSGWVVAEQHLENGQRQVIDVFVPGQVLGLREIAYHTGLCNFTSLTEAVICPFPKRSIVELFEKSARLTDLFFLILAREQATLVERIVNLGRRSAIEKVAHFLLEMHERLSIANDELGNTYRLPMTQRCIGDTLGLSSVHVSRSFARLTMDGLLQRAGNEITLLDLERLRDIAGFDATYLGIDQSWLRGPKV